MRDADVAIVGLACVFPGAADLKSYWRNIVNGVDAIRTLPHDRWPGSLNCDLPRDHFAHIACRKGGFIPTPFRFDAIRFKVMPSVAAGGDADQFVLLQVLDDALRDANISANDPRRANTDVIVGRGGFTNKMMDLLMRADVIERTRRFLEQRLPGADPREIEGLVEEMNSALPAAEADSLATSIPNLVASRAANRLNLRGAAYNVDAACASSLIAVEQCMHRLREGSCDVALACGVSFTNIPTFWYLFTRILALSPTGAIRPFDCRADGLLIGEGAGAAVLKRLDDAVRDGDRIYALIRGAGSASDGNDVGVLAPSPSGQVRALERAYADAAVDPDTVGLLEAHGTGTSQGDAVEIESMERFYGRRQQPHGTRVMGSIKSMIGHTMAAAGMASLIKTALALSSKLLPPSLHCEQPRPELEATPFFVSGRVRPWVHGSARPPRRAGINAFGFGGINAHLVLEELPEAPASRPRAPRARPPLPELQRPSELLTFTGSDPSRVARRIRRAARFVREAGGGLELEELAWTLTGEADPRAPCKLALVATDPVGLTAELDRIAGTLERGEPLPEGEEIFFGTDAARHRGKIVGLFPGLAFPGLLGDYPEHLMAMCAHQPAMREVFDLIEDRDELPDDPLPTSFLLRPPEHLPEEVRRRMRIRFAVWVGFDGQNLSPERSAGHPTPMDERLLSVVGMLASNEAGWRLLRPFGIPFDMLCGQSLGDLSALCAAGSLDFAEARERIWPYLKIDPRAADLGCLALVSTSEAQLAAVLDRLPEVIIALHVSPDVQILGGPKDRIGDAVRRLREEGVFCMILPIPPIHTPRMRAIQREIVEANGPPLPPFRKPNATVYSSLTSEPMPDSPDALRELVMSNFSHPMRFWQTLRRIHDDGGRIFIQVGSGTLAGNVQTVLPGEDVLSVALDVDYRDPVRQLQHLCGKLFVAGVPLDLSALFQARSPRRLDLDAPAATEQPPRGAVPLKLYWPPLRVEPQTDRPRPAKRSRPEPPSSGMPFVGRVVEFEERHKLVHVRRFSLEEDRYLTDHTLLGRQHGKPAIDSFPVVPLTVTLEMMAEAAACVAPGCGVTGVEEMRAKRWIGLDGVDEQEVTVEAIRISSEDDVTRVNVDVRVDGESVATGRVLLASRYRERLELRFSELTGARPFPLPVERLYSDHHFFHGPRFHCLGSIRARGDQGLVGELVVPDYGDFLRSRTDPVLLLDPVVLDGTAQLLGAMVFDRSVHILPVAVERIELYRPSPPPGTRVPVRLEVTEWNPEERRIRAIVEVQDGSGGVWFRIAGLQELIFRYSKRLLLVQREPARHTLSERSAIPGLPDGAVATVLPRSSLKDARPEYLARVFLHPDEREAFEAAGSNRAQQREWLMGRIAAKDAVRLWLGGRGDGPMLHPDRLVIDRDPAGRPVVRDPEGGSDLPAVSIAHKADVAAAVATDGPIGIDVEPSDAGKRLRLEDFATAGEIARLRQTIGDEDPAWLTRLWCGKEAAAKALGTGLQGRPAAFEAVELDAGGRLVVENGEPRRRVRVLTSQTNGWTFAVASIPSVG